MGQLHRIGPLLVLAVGVGAIIGSVALSLGALTAPGPGLWPFLVALLLTGTALVLVVVDDPEDYEPLTRGSARIAGGLAGLAVFVAAFEVIGFLLPAFLMLLLWLRVFGREPWRWALGLGARRLGRVLPAVRHRARGPVPRRRRGRAGGRLRWACWTGSRRGSPSRSTRSTSSTSSSACSSAR